MRTLTLREGMTENEDAHIRKQLRDFNLRTAPPSREYIFKNVQLVLDDEVNRICGGLIGKIYRSCLSIDILWVSENARGLGYGSKLISEAERIAREEDCRFIHLDTYSFQAPGFYKKNGFEIFGVLDLYSDGIKRYYLKKEL